MSELIDYFLIVTKISQNILICKKVLMKDCNNKLNRLEKTFEYVL